MLRDATPGYAAQPYQHLAARYVAEGHTGYQRDVLVAQQDDRRDRVLRHELRDAHGLAWWRLRTRLVGLWFSRWVVGYGYRPWRAAWWLLGIIAAAIVLSVGAAHTYASSTGQHVASGPRSGPVARLRLQHRRTVRPGAAIYGTLSGQHLSPIQFHVSHQPSKSSTGQE